MKTYSAQALPYEFDFDLEHTALLIIDMQRDFCEHGGFGEKLGNDIALTKGIIPTVKTMLEAAREKGMMVIHTREGHRPDLSDCPPAKLNRGRKQGAGIGDMGPMGRILVRGEYGRTPMPIDPEFRKKIIGDVEPIDCRPADLIPDELEKIRAEIPAGLIEQEEDVLSYAQFGQVAIKFFERRRDKKYGVDADHVDRANKVHPV